MQKEETRRECEEHFVRLKHLKLKDLKKEAELFGLTANDNKYLYKKNIPAFPRPEFHVSRLKHETQRSAIGGICEDEGFRPSIDSSKRAEKSSLVWWSLAVGPEEIQSAEARLLKKIYPNQTKEQAAVQQSFLWKFATSPAFSEKSRYGSYRFTFPLEEVLKAYSQQFCSGDPPIMRVFRTSLFKQEVEYAVLVHSPANQERFSEFPLLPDGDPNAVCAYGDGRFIWRPEAMCETHSYALQSGENLLDACEVPGRPEFYVWDNVAIALHVEDQQVLEVGAGRLRDNLTFCQKIEGKIPYYISFDEFKEAQDLVQDLWPKSPPLEEEPSLLKRFTVKEPKEEPMEAEDSQQ